MSCQRFRKGDREQRSPGSWWFDTWGDGEGVVVMIACVNGHESTLWRWRDGMPPSEHHKIVGGGQVTPSVVCPRDGCDFHEFIELGGWEGFDAPELSGGAA